MSLIPHFFICQLTVFGASFIIIILLAIGIALIAYYPFIGLERALLCQTKLQAVLSGRHPLEQVVRCMDDQYFGRYTSDWLGGDKRLTEKARQVPPDHLEEYATQSLFVAKSAVYKNQAYQPEMPINEPSFSSPIKMEDGETITPL